ncbi:MAG TPA: hypothetical protein DEQ43_12255 [Nocardioides bacterium]|uniref:DUF3105 domain-containing protein n=1 Tax=uncultured Nocardioides sp. TaxID=198441 RepID=UPI000ED94B53|nr:DUF3105 domain-containing protein [uncultured Nocardioides sp.]HCB04994.1 hypothetical protein [Nocardioides sp.]HRD64033.1 DUF3105 domain-containing protein [Nocardioides sp.]HRK48407.1 DUF3105 domain-containing protein [Nocardioides sp.]
MAKKSTKSDRQAVIDDIRRKQKGGEKRRGFAIVGVCVLVAVLIVAAAAYRPVRNWYDLRQFKDIDLASIGAPASSCSKVETKPADGNQQHVPTGSQVTYSTAPPAFGSHWNEQGVAPAPFNRKYYTAKDRPELEALVHNLEHGYTILWYDETIADDPDQLNVINGIADKFRSDSNNLRYKFIAAPWTADDVKESGAFPDGKHVAISHWSAGGSSSNDASKQVGVFQYCAEPSGAALEKFMLDYPYTDSPEPDAM